MRSKRQDVGGSFYRRKAITTEDFNGHASGELRQIELHYLGEAREIHNHENRFVFVAAQKRQHLRVIWKKELERAAGKSAEIFPGRDDAAHPPKER